MDRWVRHLAKQIGAAGLCLTVLVGMLKGLGPLEMLLRGVVIGLVLYFGVVLVGGLVGQALLRMAVEDQMAAEAQKAQEAKARAEDEDDEDLDEGEETEDETEEDEDETGADAGQAKSGAA